MNLKKWTGGYGISEWDGATLLFFFQEYYQQITEMAFTVAAERNTLL